MSFSEKLCRLMEGKPVGTYRLAKDLNVHVSTVTNWRNGSEPKIEKLVELADYFGVPLDELVAERKEKHHHGTLEFDVRL